MPAPFSAPSPEASDKIPPSYRKRTLKRSTLYIVTGLYILTCAGIAAYWMGRNYSPVPKAWQDGNLHLRAYELSPAQAIITSFASITPAPLLECTHLGGMNHTVTGGHLVKNDFWITKINSSGIAVKAILLCREDPSATTPEVKEIVREFLLPYGESISQTPYKGVVVEASFRNPTPPTLPTQ